MRSRQHKVNSTVNEFGISGSRLPMLDGRRPHIVLRQAGA
jgi:hypothetical protein